jgi:hypothetical protein
LPAFSLTNEVVGGQAKQVLQMTNGISLHFTSTNIVFWFAKDSTIAFDFDQVNRKPTRYMLQIPDSDNQPRQSILDINADGLPELRELKGQQKRQILFRGECRSVSF